MMEEMEKHSEQQPHEPETQPAEVPLLETIHLSDTPAPRKPQHADDIALTQCILCLLLVLCVFGLHWLKPEWQIMLLEQYAAKRDAPPVLWLDQLLRAVQLLCRGGTGGSPRRSLVFSAAVSGVSAA